MLRNHNHNHNLSENRAEEIVIKTHLYNVDSRFRRNTTIDPSTDYRFTLQTPVRNAVSIRISSVELPNTYPHISSLLHTNEFVILYAGNELTITISAGNYTSTQIIDAIKDSLDATGKGTWEITLNEITGKTTITELNGTPFDLYFDKENLFPKRTRDFGLGAVLGFREKIYTGQTTYTSEGTINLYGDSYVLIQINDYDLINTRSREKEVYTALAKIILDAPKNNYVFDNKNCITKRYVFSQPQEVSALNIKVLNPNGDVIDFGEQDWSMTIEIEVLENSHLYELYRTYRCSL